MNYVKLRFEFEHQHLYLVLVLCLDNADAPLLEIVIHGVDVDGGVLARRVVLLVEEHNHKVNVVDQHLQFLLVNLDFELNFSLRVNSGHKSGCHNKFQLTLMRELSPPPNLHLHPLCICFGRETQTPAK